MKAFGIIVIMICQAFVSPLDGTILSYTFKRGDEYTMTQVMKQTMKQSILGMQQSGESSNAGVMKFKVLSVTGTGARLEAQFLKLRITSKNMLGEMIMDSESAEQTSQNKIFKAMMNKTFFVLMNKNGHVEGVEGDENLWSGIDANTSDDDTKKALQILQQQFDKNSLKNSIEQAMVQYPENKVKPGDTWRSQRDFPLGLPIQADYVWTLAELNGTSAKINADGAVTTTDKEKVFTLPIGIRAKADLKGRQTVKSNVNRKTGWANDLSIHAELTGKMLLLAGGMMPMDMETPMEIVTETSYVIVKNK